jgi:hypothetical protein
MNVRTMATDPPRSPGHHAKPRYVGFVKLTPPKPDRAGVVSKNPRFPRIIGRNVVRPSFHSQRAIFLTVLGTRAYFFAATLIALATVSLTGAASTATLDWPFGRVSHLPSPDGRHIVYGERYRGGIRNAPELWLRHHARPERKRLLELSATAKVFWSPDSGHFVIVNREGSDTMTSSVYNTNGRVVLEISPQDSDNELRRIATGHFYVEAQRFLVARTVRVAAYGHTDEGPVQCFRFIYSITVSGRVDRLSKRISPATATTCDEISE